ncbi:MAG TPA: hypothetical protein VNR39_09425 [Pseudolabrys sp.]|nr:hypothetical protein [Pseudolabrys sp.]
MQKFGPSSRIGKEFYSLSQTERNAVEALTRHAIKEFLMELGDDACRTTRRQVFDAVAPAVYRAAGVRPMYVYNKIARDFGAYLSTVAGGPGTPNPFTQTLKADSTGITHTDDQHVETVIPQAATSHPDTDCDFTPYAALLPGEPSHCSDGNIESMLRDAAVRAFRAIINGSPQYGIRRAEIDAEFVGWMQWRRSRVNSLNLAASEVALTLDRHPERDFDQKRIAIHLRTCVWHLEGDDRSYDFPTLMQEAYSFPRGLAWLIARCFIRAGYLADAAKLEELARLCLDSLAKPPTPFGHADERKRFWRVENIWRGLSAART